MSSFLLNVGLMNLARLGVQQSLGILLSRPHRAGAVGISTTLSFYVHAGDPNPGPPVCVENAFPDVYLHSLSNSFLA